MSAEPAGSCSEKASGIRIATPLTGPRPGRAPTIVPTKQPVSASTMLIGVSASWKPWKRKPRVSTATPSGAVKRR